MHVLNLKNKLIYLFLFNIFISQIASAQTELESKTNDQSISVSVKTLSGVLIERKLEVPAETVSVNTSQLSSEIVGVVKEISVEIGQQVSKGDVLLKLDATDYKLAYKLIQTNLASNAARIQQAEIRLQRANNLNENNYIAADDLLARQTDLNVLKAEKSSLKVSSKQAQRNVDKTVITAPFDGILIERTANIGTYVSPGIPLIKIVQSNNAEIYADVPAHLSSSLNQTQNIVFRAGELDHPVKLVNMSSVIQNGTRTQKARFRFISQQAPIGSSGELIWIVSEGLLPPDLVVSRNRQLGVFTVVDDKAVFVALPNAQEGRPVATELDKGSMIIIGGRDKLQDGDRIKVK